MSKPLELIVDASHGTTTYFESAFFATIGIARGCISTFDDVFFSKIGTTLFKSISIAGILNISYVPFIDLYGDWRKA